MESVLGPSSTPPASCAQSLRGATSQPAPLGRGLSDGCAPTSRCRVPPGPDRPPSSASGELRSSSRPPREARRRGLRQCDSSVCRRPRGAGPCPLCRGVRRRAPAPPGTGAPPPLRLGPSCPQSLSSGPPWRRPPQADAWPFSPAQAGLFRAVSPSARPHQALPPTPHTLSAPSSSAPPTPSPTHTLSAPSSSVPAGRTAETLRETAPPTRGRSWSAVGCCGRRAAVPRGPHVPRGRAGRPCPISPLSVPSLCPPGTCGQSALRPLPTGAVAPPLLRGTPSALWSRGPPRGGSRRPREAPGAWTARRGVVRAARGCAVRGGRSPTLPVVECGASGLLGAEQRPGDDGAHTSQALQLAPVVSVAGVGRPGQAPASWRPGDACRRRWARSGGHPVPRVRPSDSGSERRPGWWSARWSRKVGVFEVLVRFLWVGASLGPVGQRRRPPHGQHALPGAASLSREAQPPHSRSGSARLGARTEG